MNITDYFHEWLHDMEAASSPLSQGQTAIMRSAYAAGAAAAITRTSNGASRLDVLAEATTLNNMVMSVAAPAKSGLARWFGALLP